MPKKIEKGFCFCCGAYDILIKHKLCESCCYFYNVEALFSNKKEKFKPIAEVIKCELEENV